MTTPPDHVTPRERVKKSGAGEWISEHKAIVICAVVVIIGLLVAIGTGTVHMPGQREPAPPATTTQ